MSSYEVNHRTHAWPGGGSGGWWADCDDCKWVSRDRYMTQAAAKREAWQHHSTTSRTVVMRDYSDDLDVTFEPKCSCYDVATMEYALEPCPVCVARMDVSA